MKELASKYDPKQVEEGLYASWLEEKAFSTPLNGKPYAVVLPPPNITGKLHLGHAWDGTLQDVMIRFKRLQGFRASWIPGMDHAGIATQSRFEKELFAKEKLRRADLSPEEFLKRLTSWAEQQKQYIRQQWGVLGFALDYAKERYTMDEGSSHAVMKVFAQLYEEGLIYQGYKLVNWDTVQNTAISNIEVIYKTVSGKMWHVRYDPVDKKHPALVVATTRPETIYGDVALVVNPTDARYKRLHNATYVNPLNGKQLSLIADQAVDKTFGTGVLKCTPAHDFTDYEIGKRHNLPALNVINFDGTMNENAGPCAGQKVSKARESALAILQESGKLVKVEEHEQNVGHSERSGVVVQPLLSNQWFVKMDQLAKNVVALQKGKGAVRFSPPRFNKELHRWLERIDDWCISRQLVWGHRIPAWTNTETKEVFVSPKAPEGKEWTRSPDVLDTWFSSALWPMICTDWPDATQYHMDFYPTSLLVTGYDILFFWVSRMMFQGVHFTKRRPFDNVLIHGLIRDEQGRKMSKSLGNGVDPMDVVASYGADSLRLFLAGSSTAGEDLRYSENRLKESWGLINKLWNAARLLQRSDEKALVARPSDTADESRWILQKAKEIAKQIAKHLEKYEFTQAVKVLKDFTWDDFCNTYLELIKSRLHAKDKKAVQTAAYVMKAVITMLHPFAPFATDRIAQLVFGSNSSLLFDQWPKIKKVQPAVYTHQTIRLLREVRRLRGEKKLDNSQAMTGALLITDQSITNHETAILSALSVENVDARMQEKNALKSGIALVTPGLTLFVQIPEGKNEKDDLKKRYLSRIEELRKELERSDRILANRAFITNADPKKVSEEKEKRENYARELEKTKRLLD